MARDGAGNLSSFVIEEFTVYTSLLGDLDNDWDVDIEDLNAFVNAWPNAGVEPSVDIGPATGTSPYLMPSFDNTCLLYTSPSPRDATLSRMPSSA